VAATDTTALAGEYAALTEQCGVVDRSERGKLALSGSGAVEFLNGQVTNELVDLSPGGGCYAAFLTHKGKMLGDLRVLAVADTEQAQSAAGGSYEDDKEEPSELLLDTERCALQALFDMIRRFKVGYEVELHKRTLKSSLLSLVGPDADKVATKAFALEGVQLSAQEHSHLLSPLGQTPVRLIRTDLGIDALFETDALERVRDAFEAAGAISVSETAAEVVRVEHGRPRYGIDLDESTIPQEAGLNERAVCFTLGPIALALVRREAEPGATVSVGEQGAEATVVELPFQ
jgi:glycine cleavage system aminomethyltransferase T